MNNSTTIPLKQYAMRRRHRATSGNQTCLQQQFVTIGSQELYFCSLYCLKDSVDSTIDPKKTPAPHLILRVYDEHEDNEGYSAPNQTWVPPDTRFSVSISAVSSSLLPQSGQAQNHANHSTTAHPKLYPTSGISYRRHMLLGSIIEGHLNRKYIHYIAQSQQLPD